MTDLPTNDVSYRNDFSLRCIVVDDEPLAGKLIASYIDRTPFLEKKAVFTSSTEVQAFLAGNEVDLIFLDIHMPRMSGMELARLVPSSTKIVFVTAYADYALEGFEVNALDYLLKPVSYEEFMRAANRAYDEAAERRKAQMFRRVETNAPEYLIVKSEYRLMRIPVEEIEFVEGLKDYVKIYVKDNRAPILTLMSMKAVEQMLPDSRFMRVHRSFIVNMASVRTIERNRIVLGDQYVPVSDSYRKQFFEAIGLGGF